MKVEEYEPDGIARAPAPQFAPLVVDDCQRRDASDVRGKSRHGLVWLVTRLATFVVACLPFRWLYLPGAVLGVLAFDGLRIRRRQILTHIARAGLPKPPALARAFFRHLGTSALEFLWLAGRPDTQLTDFVQVDGREKLESALALGRGVIVVTAHTGNWDLSACVAAEVMQRISRSERVNSRLAVVSKALSASSLNDFWMETRRRRGITILPALGVFRAASALLRQGAAVAMMIDQDPERQTGVTEAPFLGEVALTDLAPATLAMRAQAPIVLALGRRTTTGHVLEAISVFFPPASPNKQWVTDTTQAITDTLDRYVRSYPTEWLWLHRRWKTRLAVKPANN